MRAVGLSSLAAALLVTGVVLTGCEPATNTGGVGSSDGGIVCDPNGWGPLNDCGGGAEPTATTEPAGSPETEPVEAPSPEPETTTPPPCDGGGARGHGLEWVFDDNGSCRPDGADRAPDRDVDVSVTWIVVRIEETGFRECVLSLRASEHSSADHYSRVITTRKDCAAQRVNTAYHPVDN